MGIIALLVAKAISAHMKSIVSMTIAGQISLCRRSAFNSSAPVMTVSFTPWSISGIRERSTISGESSDSGRFSAIRRPLL